MSKSTVDEIIGKLKAYAREGITPTRQRRPHLGFASKHEADVFRAAAGAHPTPVLVTRKVPAALRQAADALVQLRTLNAVIVTGGTAYKLTPSGKRKAIEEGLIGENSDA